jgi:hypothetical protein
MPPAEPEPTMTKSTASSNGNVAWFSFAILLLLCRGIFGVVVAIRC